MKRMLVGAMLALGLLVFGLEPASAGGALIETTAPLADRSDESVKAAVIAAIDKAVRGAAAMGFAWFELRDAQIAGNEVAIQILAMDEEPEREGLEAPEEEGATDQQVPESPGMAAVSRIDI